MIALAFSVEAGYFRVGVLILSNEPSCGSMEREKLFLRVVAGAGSGVLVLHLVFAYRWLAWGWGVHHLAFSPPWMQIGLSALGLILILPPVCRGGSPVDVPFYPLPYLFYFQVCSLRPGRNCGAGALLGVPRAGAFAGRRGALDPGVDRSPGAAGK